MVRTFFPNHCNIWRENSCYAWAAQQQVCGHLLITSCWNFLRGIYGENYICFSYRVTLSNLGLGPEHLGIRLERSDHGAWDVCGRLGLCMISGKGDRIRFRDQELARMVQDSRGTKARETLEQRRLSVRVVCSHHLAATTTPGHSGSPS